MEFDVTQELERIRKELWGATHTRSWEARSRRRVRRHRVLATVAFVVVLATATAGALQMARDGSARAGPSDETFVIGGVGQTGRLVGVPANGTAYGPAIQQLREATANLLECEYANGASRGVPVDGTGGFRVMGITAVIRTACASEQAAIDAVQTTQAYANDAAATVQVQRAAIACAAVPSFPLAPQDPSLATVPVMQGPAAVELACKEQFEEANGIQETTPLP